MLNQNFQNLHVLGSMSFQCSLSYIPSYSIPDLRSEFQPPGLPDVYPIGIPAWCVVPHLVASALLAVFGIEVSPQRILSLPATHADSPLIRPQVAMIHKGFFIMVFFFQKGMVGVGCLISVSVRNSVTSFSLESRESRLALQRLKPKRKWIRK